MSHLVIVGGSKGIGRDIQPALEACGHYVTALPRDAPLADASHKREWGYLPIDAVLFCQRYRGDDEWDGELRVSLTRTKQIMESVAALRRSISVVMMSSVAASSVEPEQPVGYHVAKAGLEAMMRYYAVTLAPLVRVNAIVPGLTVKPEARPFYGAHPALEATYTDITPLARMCSVEDLAFEINNLIDPRSYKTGQTITLDGGIGLRSHWALARKVTPALKDLEVTQRRYPNIGLAAQ